MCIFAGKYYIFSVIDIFSNICAFDLICLQFFFIVFHSLVINITLSLLLYFVRFNANHILFTNIYSLFNYGTVTSNDHQNLSISVCIGFTQAVYVLCHMSTPPHSVRVSEN